MGDPNAPAPAPTPESPRLIFRDITAAMAVVAAILAILVLHFVGCRFDPLGRILAPSKGVAGPGPVTVQPDQVVFTPPSTKAVPHPSPVHLPKAPDDKVDVRPDGNGGSLIEIQRLALIHELTFGILWNGSAVQDVSQDLEPVVGMDLLKYSNLRTGPLLTPKRFGWGLDWRQGNITGLVGPAFKFDGLAPGVVASINVVPFD